MEAMKEGDGGGQDPAVHAHHEETTQEGGKRRYDTYCHGVSLVNAAPKRTRPNGSSVDVLSGVLKLADAYTELSVAHRIEDPAKRSKWQALAELQRRWLSRAEAEHWMPPDAPIMDPEARPKELTGRLVAPHPAGEGRHEVRPCRSASLGGVVALPASAGKLRLDFGEFKDAADVTRTTAALSNTMFVMYGTPGSGNRKSTV
eukprot:TRINITY_DN1234_c0_g1_i2.p1 TRINITY_DN1234_c0_g1~~TRINITY_DN1234_c0_g1_i2.p1  ORF type:complete len:202 (-),score=15.60 TRINITY_DN1234_c0_g1_i2:297-902(-)